LWSVAVQEKPYPIDAAKLARKKFCSQVAGWDDELKESYVASAIDNLSNNRLPL